jgi:hypothetical protein
MSQNAVGTLIRASLNGIYGNPSIMIRDNSDNFVSVHISSNAESKVFDFEIYWPNFI